VNRELKPILAIVAAAAVLVLVALMITGGRTETTVLPPVALPPPGEVGPTGYPIAVVMSTRQDQETAFLGLLKGKSHYLVGVQFYAPSACSNLVVQGEPWPTPDVDCSSEVPVSGIVTGLGVARTGETIVLVEVETSEECFMALERGDTWPPDVPMCALGRPATRSEAYADPPR